MENRVLMPRVVLMNWLCRVVWALAGGPRIVHLMLLFASSLCTRPWEASELHRWLPVTLRQLSLSRLTRVKAMLG